MVLKYKKIILSLTIVLVLIIFLQGQLNNFKSNKSEFSTTPKPLTAFNEAQKQKKPVFLEFYADW